MKAVTYHNYGSPDDVLELRGIDRPRAKDRKVLA